MVYPERDMAEVATDDGAEEKRQALIATTASEILKLIRTQDPVVVANQLAEEQLSTQTRITQLEAENAALQTQSDRDPYNPKIYSANGWHRVMKDKLAELKRNKQGAVILAVDLDDFKLYNDTTQSHLEGDKALGLAGQLMKNVLRPTDIVARLHGDEYVIVASGAEMDAGVIVAERVRQVITQMSALLETSVPFSASIGIARLEEEVIQTDYSSDEQLVAALKQAYDLADKAQYGAKQVSKNRIGVMLSDGKIQTTIVNTTAGGQTPTITYQEP